MQIDDMRQDSSRKQKKGLHFILASVVIWAIVFGIHSTSLPILSKNLWTFCATTPLVPLAFFISKWIRVDFQNKDNPLTKLGLLFSFNQILYLLIAMWIYPTIPDKLVMVIAIIFGAHLLPYGWLYQSKTYYVFSVIIPVGALLIGLFQPPQVLALTMIFVEIAFCLLLVMELKKQSKLLPYQ